MFNLNQDLIKQLRDGKIAVKYDYESLELLRAILKEAFPNDVEPDGDCDSYEAFKDNKEIWTAGDYMFNALIHVPVADFVKPTEDKLSKAAPELLQALQNLVGLHNSEMEGIESGKPTLEQWYNAVNEAEAIIKKVTE